MYSGTPRNGHPIIVDTCDKTDSSKGSECITVSTVNPRNADRPLLHKPDTIICPT